MENGESGLRFRGLRYRPERYRYLGKVEAERHLSGTHARKLPRSTRTTARCMLINVHAHAKSAHVADIIGGSRAAQMSRCVQHAKTTEGSLADTW